jgi:putative membrane protein
MFRTPLFTAAIVLAGFSALAQIGNPAGMGVDTKMARPGIPAPHQTNNQDRLFAQLAASGGLAEIELGRLEHKQ